MKTTKKQMVNFATLLINEIAKSNKDISFDYRNSHISIWFYSDGKADSISLYNHYSLKDNKKIFKLAILKIREF